MAETDTVTVSEDPAVLLLLSKAKFGQEQETFNISHDHIDSLIQDTPSRTSWKDVEAQLFPFE